MKKHLQLRYTVAMGACLGAPAFAAGLGVGIEIPRLDVAEYHRPYVAVWVERADATVASTLAVWYDVKMKDAEGSKWLRTCASGGAARAANCRCRSTA